ncbi:YciI family protein [Kiloniella majae]|uniref:YciI family protein n=1 Tax=Kiloniella majae TaxID=1938558 RepID=UPI000A279553|nr:YciI family protein [Kiloniella majae]
MNFVVTAMDYKDEAALGRRLKMRDAHLSGLSELVAKGHFLSGGAILNDDGKMIGSSAHVCFEDEEQLYTWINKDPYILGKVWEQVDVRKIGLFPVKR